MLSQFLAVIWKCHLVHRHEMKTHTSLTAAERVRDVVTLVSNLDRAWVIVDGS